MATRGAGAFAEVAGRSVQWATVAEAACAAACACAATQSAFARSRAPTLAAQCVNLLNLLLLRGPEYLFGSSADYHNVLATIAAHEGRWQRLEAAAAAAGWLAPTPVYVPPSKGRGEGRATAVRTHAPRTAVLRLTNVLKVSSIVCEAQRGAAGGAVSAGGLGGSAAAEHAAATTNTAAMLLAVKRAPLGMLELFPFDRLDAAYALEAAGEGEGAAEARALAAAARVILADVRQTDATVGTDALYSLSAGLDATAGLPQSMPAAVAVG